MAARRRKLSAEAKPGIAELYSDIPSLPSTLQQLQAAAVSPTLTASHSGIRRDMAGTPINMLLLPQTYQERVARVWDGYNTDTFFHRLVNRTVDFAANGARWEVPAQLDKQKSWIKRLTDSVFGTEQRKEQDFWNAWGDSINEGVPNVLPGMQEVTRWAVRHLLLGAMWVPHFEWGEFTFGRQEFLVPTKMTCYPASAILLKRPNDFFEEEQVYYRPPSAPAQNKLIDMREGQPAIAQGIPTDGMDPLPKLGTAKKAGQNEAFALKYNWSPGDLVTYRVRGYSTTGQALYPHPPFFALLPQLAIRQKLFAADLSILDGIIQQIFMWKIGDKETPPTPPLKDASGNVVQDGTIATVRKLIQDGRTGPALELFLPYYVDLVIKQPDTAVLVNETKYAQSTLEIFQAFGIFFARSAAGSRERMEKINVTNFEEFLDAIRWHVKSFWHLMARRIVEMNKGKLSGVPIWSPRPLNTKNEAFTAQLMQLAKMGKISLETLLYYHGIDSAVEVPRIARELATDTDDMTDANSPVSYVQSVQPPDYGEKPATPLDPSTDPSPDGTTPTKETVVNPGKQQGRPRGRPRKTAPAPSEDADSAE